MNLSTLILDVILKIVGLKIVFGWLKLIAAKEAMSTPLMAR